MVGAGAVGGYLAARLISSNQAEVAIIERGPHLSAIRNDGLRLITPEEELRVRPVAVVESASELPAQDIVFVALKTTAYAGLARNLVGLLARDGYAMFINNGIPWWWNSGLSRRERPLALLDPGEELWRVLTPERVLGCVIYSMNEVIAPGVIQHNGNNRWIVGEPNDTMSERMTRTAHLLKQAGLNAECSLDLRRNVWAKLLRNAPLNSICALTRLSIAGLAGEPGILKLVNAVIDEIVAVASAHGSDISEYVSAARAAPTLGGAVAGQKVGEVKPSMLQDALAGRAMEVEAILGQPESFAREAGIPTPAIDVILPLLRALNHGLQTAPRDAQK